MIPTCQQRRLFAFLLFWPGAEVSWFSGKWLRLECSQRDLNLIPSFSQFLVSRFFIKEKLFFWRFSDKCPPFCVLRFPLFVFFSSPVVLTDFGRLQLNTFCLLDLWLNIWWSPRCPFQKFFICFRCFAPLIKRLNERLSLLRVQFSGDRLSTCAWRRSRICK